MDINCLINKRIIAIMRGLNGLKLLRTAEALNAGGIDCIEVAFENDDLQTANDIDTLKKFIGDKMHVGAGTVTTIERARMAINAGATFIMAPNADENIIKFVKESGIIMIAGAITPTEVMNAVKWGADAIKVFPTSVFGPDYVRALKAPFKDVIFIAASGVDENNIDEYIAAGYSAAGISRAFSDVSLAEKGQFDVFTDRAKALIDSAK